jgi:hypothetical protein
MVTNIKNLEPKPNTHQKQEIPCNKSCVKEENKSARPLPSYVVGLHVYRRLLTRKLIKNKRKQQTERKGGTNE